jgi:hypothetical protein
MSPADISEQGTDVVHRDAADPTRAGDTALKSFQRQALCRSGIVSKLLTRRDALFANLNQ